MDRNQAIASFRAFNRFFTTVIGVLDEDLLDSGFGLTEARAIYELGAGNARTARDLELILGIDKGYLSRIINRLDGAGLLERTPSPADRRTRLIALSPHGRDIWAGLQARSNQQLAEVMAEIPDGDVHRLVESMRQIESILRSRARPESVVTIRPFRAGDLGWIVARHGAVYWDEYGWNHDFEALVAEVVANFVRDYRADREQCWIAEIDGRPVGSVMCVRVDDHTAKLRLLLVESDARGRGVGKALVETCIAFARGAGYRELVLWTNDVLIEARAIYERRGFVRVSTEPHESFGHNLMSEVWRLDLTADM
jgi:DNA-binding MarR family transcriptional regulator/GNAT superfamily N-acetyltransferase